MIFLIADDNNEKQKALDVFIKENFKNSTTFKTYAFNTTFDFLRKKETEIDLVFLDMTMPSFESHEGKQTERTLRTLAGKDLISKLYYRNIKVKVIIVTQFEVFGRHDQITSLNNIYLDLKDKYPEMVLGCVVFDFQSDRWKSQLLKIIRDTQ